jgi:glycerophosphoryl diester phosphodiesterase
MTMAEIENLRTEDGETVPTLEELLTEAHADHIKLYIELKGDTADEKMVDDVVAMIREKGMTDETAVISLKYDVLNYCETAYPEIETGYLYFLAYGDTTKLNVDDLIIEESLAGDETVSAIHAAHKKAMVWTVNSPDALERQLSGRADGIITDSVKEAADEKKRLAERTDRERIIDGILRMIS